MRKTILSALLPFALVFLFSAGCRRPGVPVTYSSGVYANSGALRIRSSAPLSFSIDELTNCDEILR